MVSNKYIVSSKRTAYTSLFSIVANIIVLLAHLGIHVCYICTCNLVTIWYSWTRKQFTKLMLQ